MVRALLFVVRRLPQHAVKEQEETTHVLLQVRGGTDNGEMRR